MGTVLRGSLVLWLLAELSIEEPWQQTGGGWGEATAITLPAPFLQGVPGRGHCSVIADSPRDCLLPGPTSCSVLSLLQP